MKEKFQILFGTVREKAHQVTLKRSRKHCVNILRLGQEC